MKSDPSKPMMLDLDDEELRHDMLRQGLLFPKVNAEGHALFDANGTSTISPEEREQMIERLEKKFSEVFEILRIDRNDPNSTDTPFRLANMWVNELFKGRYTDAPRLTVFPNRTSVDELVISRGIRVMSVCSHHWQPIIGDCAIGYVPKDKVIGLSKLTRVVEWFARRGQIQEELGEQIADYLTEVLDPIALGVVIKSKHYCMIARGVEAGEQAEMITSVMRGELATNQTLRNEFLKLITERS